MKPDPVFNVFLPTTVTAVLLHLYFDFQIIYTNYNLCSLGFIYAVVSFFKWCQGAVRFKNALKSVIINK